VTILLLLSGCSILSSTSTSRFPEFNTVNITGPGEYQLPQWSPDSQYLAFLDVAADPVLKVYDTQSRTVQIVAQEVSSIGFAWQSNDRLSYYKYRPDLSGTPLPSISELHSIDITGHSDQLIAGNLHDAGDFAWLDNGQEIVILLSEDDSSMSCRKAYLLDIGTEQKRLLVPNSTLGVSCLTMMALSPDQESLLTYGIEEENGVYEAWISVYDLQSQTVLETFKPSEIIPSGQATYPVPAISDDSNFDWVGDERWVLAAANTPSGECYNYALFFFDTNDLTNSTCITSTGVFSAPVISPDLTKISYITVKGPGNNYLTIGDVPPSLLAQLELGSKEDL
jgi:Tol biopolymer transport system component